MRTGPGGAAAAEDPAVARLRAAVRALAELTRDRPPTGRRHDNADDVAGTAGTDDAVGFDPLPVLRALAAAGATAVVMGQVAGIMHGSTEPTGDLDLLWDGDPAQAPALAAGFAAVSAGLVDDDGAPVPCRPAAFALPKVVFRTATASGDCCTPALGWGDLPIAAYLARARVARTGGGYPIRYLDRADLIAMRLAVGRPKDLRRAAELARLPDRSA